MSTIYVHWPFCLSKCYYCDFYSLPCTGNIDFDFWFNSYKNVLGNFYLKFYNNEDITSIYFGGGTPSLLPSFFINNFIDLISQKFKLGPNPEITIEVNPKTIDNEKAKNFKAAGINRISIGIQSFIDDDLKLLGRIHNSKEALECLDIIENHFDNISIDLIYNRPGQGLTDWEDELKYALKLPINHVSLYELIVEENTKIKNLIESKKIPDQNPGSEFFENTIAIAEAHGFQMYEVSNFSKPGYEGRHNLSYWKYENYYGIGPSSHSRVEQNNQKIAIEQIADNKTWLAWAQSTNFEQTILSEDDVFEEKLIFGLRSKVGLDLQKLSNFIKNKYNLSKKIERLCENSYIIKEENVIKLTKNGLLKLNLIIEYMAKEHKI